MREREYLVKAGEMRSRSAQREEKAVEGREEVDAARKPLQTHVSTTPNFPGETVSLKPTPKSAIPKTRRFPS